MVRLLFILLFSVSVCYGQANRFAGFGYRAPLVGCSSANYLTDAQKFIDSSGITDTVEIRAIKELIKDLQDSCLWTKMKAVYPFVGSSGNSTRWNLKSPFNQDTSYRIVWNGTMNYGSYGVQSNGSSGYGDTKFKPSDFISSSSGAMGVYIGNNVDGPMIPIGESNQPQTLGWIIIPRSSNTAYGNAGIGYSSASSTNSIGLWIITVETHTSSTLRKDNAVYITLANGGSSTARNIYISARNADGTANSFSTHKIGFAFFSSGLTANESNTLYVIVNKFKTTLSR